MATTMLSGLWDSTRMRLLVEIERQGSLSAAAAEVGIGQPSASEHLRLLEAAAGQRLVERNGRGSRPTEAGRGPSQRARGGPPPPAGGGGEGGARPGARGGAGPARAPTATGGFLAPPP